MRGRPGGPDLKHRYGVIATRFGEALAVLDGDGALCRLSVDVAPPADAVRDDAAVAHVARQLAEYEAGERRRFDLALAPHGSPFQQRVWALLREIPFGRTRTYGELAAALGDPGLSRAVGRANATNPIWLVVPCHRVIGADGSLTGYAGGLALKAALLRFETGRFAEPLSLFGGMI
ncbi:MAG TPA: methylated-DNA--[protein]-cysteine S-methyltransferase [Candidatus Limnocylindria bacterium]|jgi:methylated-DNA-[protein]-cysteine S-methyltransferase|nr:methylated-DNA--[protein]-cysteine S-methyltransferase [Candidatus Limnocylindria bacterium]